MFVPLTPLEFKRRAATLFGNKIGVVDGDRRFTYREFGERADCLANALLQAGLQPGDRVAYLAYNSHPLLEGYFGVLAAGGILLPLNIRLAPEELAYILDHASASFLLADQDFLPLIKEIWPRLEGWPQLIWLSGRPERRGEPLYEELLQGAPSSPPPALEIDENQTAELFYTSGTTGRPKGVMLTHRNLYLHALGALVQLPLTATDVQLHTIPLFHVNGWGTPQFLTAVGGTHVMMRRFDPGDALRLVEQERVTRFLAVPTMLNMILNHPDIERYDLSSLELVMTGGAPTPPDMIRRAQRLLGCTVMSGYGLSETTPILTRAKEKCYLEEDEDRTISRRATTGLPVIGVDVKIVDENGEDLPWNRQDVGEIVVRSNVVMKGYWNDPQATDAVMQDGWFHTGDMAVIDEEGYALIVDRKKDIIISGGENISSVEIEKVIFEHPAVLESAVIGVPDERWGEVPLALVVLRPGMVAGQEDIMEFCGHRLAGFKVPKRVEFVESLPKGGTGKILKRLLREPHWQGYQKMVH